MTASGTPPADEATPEQEGIWDDASDGETSSAGGGAEAATSGAAGLTRRLTSTEHEPGPAGLLYADVPNRIMALAIDVVVLSVIGSVLAWALGGLVTEAGAIDSAGGELDVTAFLLVLVLQLAISFVYFASLWTLAGATAGMRLLSLRVGDETDGRRIGWRAAVIRWLILGLPSLLSSLAVYVPNTIGLILGALGVVWMLLLLYTMAQSPAKQGLHDRFARTIVIKARRRAV